MYAVIAHSGQQFRLAEGDELVLDRINAEAGDSVDIDNVLHLPHTTRQGKDAQKLPTVGEWTKVTAGPNAKSVQHVIDFDTNNRFTALQ